MKYARLLASIAAWSIVFAPCSSASAEITEEARELISINREKTQKLVTDIGIERDEVCPHSIHEFRCVFGYRRVRELAIDIFITEMAILMDGFGEESVLTEAYKAIRDETIADFYAQLEILQQTYIEDRPGIPR